MSHAPHAAATRLSSAYPLPGHFASKHGKSRAIRLPPADHDLRGDLRRIAQPVTIAVGRHDVTSSPVPAAEFHRLIPGSQLVTCDGPHLLALERPAELSQIIRGHLGWVAERNRLGGRAGT